MEDLYVESYQMVNLSFLRLRLAIYCREKCGKTESVGECAVCELNDVKKYLDDPGQSVGKK